MFEIEKGIPLARMAGHHGNAIYPFAKMEVGDSFAITFGESASAGILLSYANVSQSAHQYGRRTAKKFAVRRSLDKLTARIWRIA